MAISIRKGSVDADSEKQILTQLIIDDVFCEQIIPIAKSEYFEMPTSKTIFRWVKEYHEKFNKSPNRLISDIFNTKSKKLSPEDRELVEDFLFGLSDKYLKDGENQNSQYYISEAKLFLEKQSYLKLAEKISSYAKLDQPDEIKKALIDHNNTTVSSGISVNLNDPEVAKKILKNEKKNKLFRLPGQLGEMIGDFEAGRVYGLLARSGIGKSFFLSELAVCAATEKYKVLMANWEMNLDQIGVRYYKRLAAMGDEAKAWLYPVIDCASNANGLCKKKQRKSKVSLINNVGDVPKFGDHNPEYKPCDACRGSKDYKFSVWHELIYKDKLNDKRLEKILSSFNMMFGDNVRCCPFPKFNATINDLENEIKWLGHRENFIPSILTVDYDGLILPERFYNEQRHNSDEIYKKIGSLTHRYGLCTFIASQVNREGSKKAKASATDIGEDWRKYQHLDGLIMLNQTDAEKEAGIIRVSMGKVRDGAFNQSHEVAVLQNLAVGQAMLDSEIIETDYGN